MDSIYDDLDVVPILDEEYKKVQTTNRQLLEKIKHLESEVQLLQDIVARMKQQQVDLEHNISSLYNTAIAECGRKDRIITELQHRVDDLTFRKDFNRRQDSYASNTSTGSSTNREGGDRNEKHKEKHPELKEKYSEYKDKYADRNNEKNHYQNRDGDTKAHIKYKETRDGKERKDVGKRNEYHSYERDKYQDRDKYHHQSSYKRSRDMDRYYPANKRSKYESEKYQSKDRHNQEHSRGSTERYNHKYIGFTERNSKSKEFCPQRTKVDKNIERKPDNVKATNTLYNNDPENKQNLISNEKEPEIKAVLLPETHSWNTQARNEQLLTDMKIISEKYEKLKRDTLMDRHESINIDNIPPEMMKLAEELYSVEEVVDRTPPETSKLSEILNLEIRDNQKKTCNTPDISKISEDSPETSEKQNNSLDTLEKHKHEIVKPKMTPDSPITFEGVLRNNLQETTFINTRPGTNLSFNNVNNVLSLPSLQKTAGDVSSIFNNSISPIPKTDSCKNKSNSLETVNVSNSTKVNTASLESLGGDNLPEKVGLSISSSNEKIQRDIVDNAKMVGMSQRDDPVSNGNQSVSENISVGQVQCENASNFSVNSSTEKVKKGRLRRRYLGKLRMTD